MNTGDRVRLVREVFVYGAGSEGVVDSMPEPTHANVNIDKDSEGNDVSPPEPLMPQPVEYFEVIG